MPLTGRQVHRIAGGSEAGVRKVLTRLARQGILHVQEAGPSLLYTANREHLAWPAVESLASLRATLLNRIAAELGEWEPAPIHASLFGSAARMDGDEDSDIDLFVARPLEITEDSEPWATQVDKLRSTVTAWTGNHCQIFQLDQARLAEHVAAGDQLVAEWQRDAVTLYGDDPAAILRRLSSMENPHERSRQTSYSAVRTRSSQGPA
jgi:hypothetical protein